MRMVKIHYCQSKEGLIMSRYNDLNIALVSLLQQLGLYSQANSISEDSRLDHLSTTDVLDVLRKYNINFHVVLMNKKDIDHTLLPFLVIPHEEPAFVSRRKDNKFQRFESEGQWKNISFRQGFEQSKMIIIENLPAKSVKSKTFSQYFSQQKKWYKPVFWLSLLSSLTGLAVPLFTMSVYDRVIGGQAPEVLPTIALGAFIALTILVGSRLIRAKVVSSASNRFARDLSDVTYSKLLRMPLMVLSRVGLSNHIARMKNAEKVRGMISGPGGAGLIDLPFTVIAFATIAFLSGWLVLVPIIMLFIYFGVMKLLNKYTARVVPTINSEYQQSINELSKNVLQLKASGQTDTRRAEFFRQCRESCRQNFLFAKRNGLKTATAHALSMFTALATVFTGIFLVLNQSITSGALIACVMLIWRITGPAQLAFSSGQKLTMMNGAIAQFDRFMQATPEQNEYRLEQPERNIAPKITINQITLRYTASQEAVLSGVSADIESGDCVAVIGPNACGKSSLLLSILGVVEPQAGYITVNNKNLKQYDPESYRSYVGFSPAEPDLFPGTLADNLRIAKPDATDEELIAALKCAGGESLFTSLASNLNIQLENNASNMLSAVEGSYINLARALLKKSSLIVLDEPLANRNPYAIDAFSKTVLSRKGKATIIFTSHDPELIKLADKVIVLDKGTVVYAGPVPDKNSQDMESTDNE